MADSKIDPILELSTADAEPKHHIVIDGESYGLADLDGFSLSGQYRMKQAGARIQELMGKNDLPEKQLKELDDLGGRLYAQIAVGVPDDLSAKLTAAQKQQVVIAFFGKVAAQQEKDQASPETGSETGQNTSPASSDSTGEASASG